MKDHHGRPYQKNMIVLFVGTSYPFISYVCPLHFILTYCLFHIHLILIYLTFMSQTPLCTLFKSGSYSFLDFFFIFISYSFHIYFIFISYSFLDLFHINFIFISYSFHTHFIFISYSFHIRFIIISYSFHTHFILITYSFHIHLYIYLYIFLYIYFIFISHSFHIQFICNERNGSCENDFYFQMMEVLLFSPSLSRRTKPTPNRLPPTTT